MSSVVWNVSRASCARNGRTRLNPRMSRKTTRKIDPSPGIDAAASAAALHRRSRPYSAPGHFAARVHESFAVALRPFERAVACREHLEAGGLHVVGGALDGPRAHLGVAHDALAALGLLAADLELRLHERDELAARSEAADDRGEQLAEADERRVDDHRDRRGRRPARARASCALVRSSTSTRGSTRSLWASCP